jgi:hypothetical protein
MSCDPTLKKYQPRDLRKIDSRVPNLIPTILIRKEAILVGPLHTIPDFVLLSSARSIFFTSGHLSKQTPLSFSIPMAQPTPGSILCSCIIWRQAASDYVPLLAFQDVLSVEQHNLKAKGPGLPYEFRSAPEIFVVKSL